MTPPTADLADLEPAPAAALGDVLAVGDAALELRHDRDGHFLGLGAIAVDGFPLRSGRLPLSVDLRTAEAVELGDFRETARTAINGGFDLRFAARRRDGGVMEWMLHTVRNRYRVADWSRGFAPAPGAALTLELRPAARTLGGVAGRGFTYRWRWHGPGLPLHKLLDRGTWEPGGSAIGNEIWQRQGFVDPCCAITGTAQRYSTEWWLPGIHNPSIFQFVPLQTAMQGFTFTWHPRGILVTWATRVYHLRSYFEKPAGQDELYHLHEHCGDLGETLDGAPMEVLWFAGAFDRVAAMNLYERVREHVWDALHGDLGMRRERLPAYGLMEEWGLPDLAAYAERGLPKLLAAGVKLVGLPNLFENHMNAYGLSNMCVTLDWRLAESLGGAAPVRRLCDLARAEGARIEMWGNTAISTLEVMAHIPQEGGHRGRFTPIAKDGTVMSALAGRPQALLRNPAGHIESDHYTPSFACLNLRDEGVRAHWLKRWGELHDDIGVAAIFLDSSFNLSNDKFHWLGHDHGVGAATIDQTHLLGHQRPAVEAPKAILSQYRAHLDLMVAMQAQGYVYDSEDVGLFGLSRSGPDAVRRAGNLFLWKDSLCTFDADALARAGHDPDRVFLAGLAWRNVWYLYWLPGLDCLSFHPSQMRGDHDRPQPRHLAWIRAYSDLEPDMTGPWELTPDGAAVVYRRPGRTVVWALDATTLALPPGATVHDAVANAPVAATGTLALARGHAYRIDAP